MGCEEPGLSIDDMTGESTGLTILDFFAEGPVKCTKIT